MKIHITNLYGMARESTATIAQNAVQKIATQLGFRELGIYFYHASAETVEERSRRLDGILASVSMGDVVIFQTPTWNGLEFEREFLSKLKLLNVKIIVFVHDVIPLMFKANEFLMQDYINLYNMADSIILPSEAMKEKLLQQGLNVKKIIFQRMWDHPHDLDLHEPIFKKEIYFAGNLSRFPELKTWEGTVPLTVFSNEEQLSLSNQVHIAGWKTDEEMLLGLSKGGFGLVWTTHQNEEQNIDYYSMNVSYKLSTYLAAGIPVIIPATLSNSDFIVEQGLGFVVDNLEEANLLVEQLSEEAYLQMCSRVRYFSFLLSQGFFAKQFLLQAVFELGISNNQQSRGIRLLTVTNSQDLEQIEYLVEQLPECDFNIAARTLMGPRLTNLAEKENVYLYPASDSEKIEELLDKTDLYLDINYGGEVDGVFNLLSDKSIPSFAFYKTQNGEKGQYLFSIRNVDAMVTAIRNYAETKQLPNKPFDFEVQTIDETLDYILEHQSSIARFGDGEAAIMLGQSINYQKYDPNLAEELKFIFNQESSPTLVIGLQEGLKNRFSFVPDALAFWRQYLEDYEEFYLEYCKNPWYGSTFISRPYIDFLDKSKAKSQFEKLKKLWEGRDILIVEGYASRSGVGNDLFDGAKSIKRIICPSRHAYDKKNEIMEAIMNHADGRLVLLMLGPTAKVLAYQLATKGVQAIDIGHVDSEYEWMQMGAETKILLHNKHTAEFNLDTEIELADDEAYLSQVVVDLSAE